MSFTYRACFYTLFPNNLHDKSYESISEYNLVMFLFCSFSFVIGNTSLMKIIKIINKNITIFVVVYL